MGILAACLFLALLIFSGALAVQSDKLRKSEIKAEDHRQDSLRLQAQLKGVTESKNKLLDELAKLRPHKDNPFTNFKPKKKNRRRKPRA